jgi:ketosteroid isomerase-like protein
MRTTPSPAPLATTLLLAASAALAAPAAAQPVAKAVHNARAVSKAAVDSAVGAVYQRFLDGLRRRDTASYRDLLTPDYVHIAGDTAQVTAGRAARLQWDMTQTNRISAFDLHRCDVRPYGEAAVGPCWYRQVTEADGKQYEFEGVSLVTFVRGGDGRWRIAATRPSLARGGPQ